MHTLPLISPWALVIDTPTLQPVLTRLIRSFGWNACGVSTLQDALAQLQLVPSAPCLVLLDWQLTDFDVATFCWILRQSAWATIPLVVMVHVTSPHDPVITQRVSAYLQKPLIMPELAALLHRFCESGAAIQCAA
jgi:DNA-binding response OmpR family regulator